MLKVFEGEKERITDEKRKKANDRHVIKEGKRKRKEWRQNEEWKKNVEIEGKKRKKNEWKKSI